MSIYFVIIFLNFYKKISQGKKEINKAALDTKIVFIKKFYQNFLIINR